LGIKRSHDRRRRVTLNGQRRNPDMFVSIISKMAGDRDSVTGAPIGYGYLGIKWSRDRWRHV